MVLFDVSCIFKGVFLHHLNLEISCDWQMLGGWQLVSWVLNEIHLFLDWLNVLSTVDTTSFENIMLKQLLYSMWMLIDRLSLLSHLAMTNYWPSTLDEGSLQSLLVVASYYNRIFEPATDHHYLSQCQPWIDEANAVVNFRWKGIDCTTENGCLGVVTVRWKGFDCTYFSDGLKALIRNCTYIPGTLTKIHMQYDIFRCTVHCMYCHQTLYVLYVVIFI
jgi:hypothetical protein